MPVIKKVGSRVQLEIQRLDGGLSTKDGPSRIEDNESPDTLNTIFDDVGAVETRQGTSYYSNAYSQTTDSTAVTHNIAMGLAEVDGLTTYNQTMVAWANGEMYRASGTTFVTVLASVGKFTSGATVAYQEYQDILFCSEGDSGPYRWEGSENFYEQGIGTPTAPTGGSDGAGDIAADTYYYAVSFINSHAVEGEVGSASLGVTLVGSAQVEVEGITLGSNLVGVNKRNVYRSTAAAGPWLYVQELADNTTTSFTDTLGVGEEGGEPPADATAPAPYKAIALHRERLWYPNDANDSVINYTEFTNPYVSKALNFENLDKGDGSAIKAVSVQDSLVSIFKENSIFLVDIPDASDDTTFTYIKAPANVGIVGPRALAVVDNGIFFLGQRNGRIAGMFLLSGIDVLETSNRILRTKSISEKIEQDILALSNTYKNKVAMFVYKQRIHIAVPQTSSSTTNDAIFWFDINRLGSDGQPGSWSIWTGKMGYNDFTVYNAELYGASSLEDGQVIQLNDGTYTEADGSGIDSYYWSKEVGGEQSIESWIKDFRKFNIWYEITGNGPMRVSWRKNSATSIDGTLDVSLDAPGDTWDNFNWDEGSWGGDAGRTETQHSFGSLLGRRVQLKFDNKAAAGKYFKVYSLKMLMNMRRQRGAVG